MAKDLWIKVKVDDKELAELGKKTQKTIEGSIEKGMKTGAQKGTGGAGAGTGMFGQMTQAIQRSQLLQTATQGAGQAFADWIGASRGTKLRIEAEANTIKTAAALAGAGIGIISGTGGQLVTQAGQAIAEEVYREPLQTGRNAQSRLEQYLNRLSQQGVDPSQANTEQVAKMMLGWEKKMYQNNIRATEAVSKAQETMFDWSQLKKRGETLLSETKAKVSNKIVSFKANKEDS